ncbi:MAG: hypothetical protein AAGF73_11075 [Actinomycetota bacterium]
MTTIDDVIDAPSSDTEAAREGRLWRWLAYAGASALGGSPVPTMMRYEDAVDAVTVVGSEG